MWGRWVRVVKGHGTGASGAIDAVSIELGGSPGGRRIPISWSIISGIWMLLDSIAVLGSGLGCYLLYVGWSESQLGLYAGEILFVWIATIMLSQYAGLTDLDAVLTPFRVLDRILIVGATCFLFLMALAFSLKVSDALRSPGC